jgi:hypothetical protein
MDDRQPDYDLAQGTPEVAIMRRTGLTGMNLWHHVTVRPNVSTQRVCDLVLDEVD